MNEMTKPAAAIKGEEHWTTKDGGVKLFLFEKCARRPGQDRGTILFVHGSSMASQPTFDLQVPGRPDSSAMDWFARRGFDCWCVDMEGYGRSDKDRDNNCAIANGADDCYAAAPLHRRSARQARRLLVYGISSGALRAALFAAAPSGARGAARARRLRVDRRRHADARASGARSCRSSSAKNRRPIDRAFVHSIFDRDHPDTAERHVIEAFADAILALDDSVPTGTYVDMCSKLPVVDPAKITVPTLIMRGQYDGIAALDDLIEVLRAAAEPRQAVHGDGRHLARELPAEELHDRLPHPGELLLAAGAGVCG